MIHRILEDIINLRLQGGKAIILLGPRQVGKTTLLKHILSAFQDETLWLSGDEPDVQQLFEKPSVTSLKALIGKKKYVVVDEAQRIQDVGLRLKLITDGIPEVQLLVSGSSALEISDKLNEPLTGRKWEYKMLPVSFSEMVSHHGLLEEKRMIAHRLIFGYYPDVMNHPGDEREVLRQLTDSFLYKDVLSLELIKKPDSVIKLLQALAFQVGSQVSYNELSRTTGLDVKTIDRYIQILEKTFILFRMGSFSRNLRTELTKSKKIYFYDNGVRNALINNLQRIEHRHDTGALWENLMVSERIKFLNYQRRWAFQGFWRTREQQEIDLIEEEDGVLRAWEFKWNPTAKARITRTFTQAYPEAEVNIIHRDNPELFLLPTQFQS